MNYFCTNCGAECLLEAKFCKHCGMAIKTSEMQSDKGKEIINGDINKKNLSSEKDSQVFFQMAQEKQQDDILPKDLLKNKKNKGKIKGIKGQEEDVHLYLVLSLLSLLALPSLLEAVLMLVAKQAIGSFTLIACEIFGIVLGILFMSFYFCKVTGNPINKNGIISALEGTLWIYIIYSITSVLIDQVEGFALNYLFNVYWVSFIIILAIIVVAFILAYSILYRTLTKLGQKTWKEEQKAKGFLNKQGVFWKSFFISLLLVLIPEIIAILVSVLPFDIPLSFVSTFGWKILILLLQSFLIIHIIKDISRVIGISPSKVNKENIVEKSTIEEDIKGEGTKSSSASLSVAVAGIILLVFFAYEIISPVFYSPIEEMKAGIKEDMHFGSLYLAEGDIEMAVKMYDRAYDRAQAWIAFVGSEGEDDRQLRSLYKSNPLDEEIEYLTAIKTYSIDELEKTIFDSKSSTDWYLALLKAYKNQEKNKDNPRPLTEKQGAIRKDLINLCIAAEHFVNSSFTLDHIKNKETKIIDAMQPYMDFVDYYGSYRILLDIGKKGGVDRDIMNRLLTYAEVNPRNILAQYMAYATGIGFLYDNAPHYERTAEAAIRFGRLYMEKIDGSQSSSHIISVNLEVANALMEVLDYKNAIAFLDAAITHGAGSQAILLSAKCYEILGDNERCREMAIAVLEEDPTNNEAMYLAMISSLKIGDIKESLVYAGQLLDLLPSLEGLTFLEVDAQVYSFVQYFSIESGVKAYPKLKEEEEKVLKENEILDSYVQAVYYTFEGRDNNRALEHGLDVWKELQDSAQVNFLLGTIHLNRREYEDATEYFKASLAIDDNAPNVWYNLATAYNSLEDYQEAFNCSAKADSMLRYNDHEVDKYGVQIHNSNLLSNLADKLK